MDPFSITVGAITLAGATKTAIGSIKRLKALRDAPEELHDLLSELSQFEEILKAIQDTADPSESVDFLVETLLGSAKEKIVEFNSLIEYQLTQAGSSSKVDRLRWMESQKYIDRLRKQLGDIRANLDLTIGVRTSITAQRNLEYMRQMVAAVTTLPQILEEAQSTGSAVTGFLSNFPHLTLHPASPDPRSVSDTTHNSVAQLNRSSTFARPSNQLRLQKTYNLARCRLDCPCECHRTSFSLSSWSLKRLFGYAYLEKKGSSWVGASRHIQSCKASAVSQIKVVYFIPTWFAMKVIHILYTSSPLHGPEWLIRIPRLVERYKSRAFVSIINNDFPGFRSAIASGECTPYDIDERGDFLLSLIVLFGRYDMFTYLVRNGVDVLQPVGLANEESWLGKLWDIFGGNFAHFDNFNISQSLPHQDLIPNFPWDEFKESERFTLLHEIVCHINGRDLENAVQIHSADINKLDRNGQSPLGLAVSNKNIAAVETLLTWGADPDLCDEWPIYIALSMKRSKSLVMIELLLRSSATVHSSTRNKIAAVWVQSPKSWEDPEILAIDSLLIEHGIDINHQAHGLTLLMKLCMLWGDKISLDRIEQLIEVGADLELRDSVGRTALHLAIVYSNVDAMKVLHYAGSRLDVKTYSGNTITHFAVIHSKLGNYPNAISEMDLSWLDLDLKNEDGHTAYDLLRKRNGLKWESYFEKYWQKHYPHIYYIGPRFYSPDDEYQVILALEALLHHIQDSQGAPKDQQYPPLGEYLCDDKDEEPVPGAWPV